MQMQKQKEVFNISNFLNAQPVGPKSKKGVSLFRDVKKEKKQLQLEKQVEKQVEMDSDSRQASEESIQLITLPELNRGDVEVDRRKVMEVVRRSEAELEGMNCRYQQKLDEVRLNFIDTFMPPGLKVKTNPYALYKYIASKPKY